MYQPATALLVIAIFLCLSVVFVDVDEIKSELTTKFEASNVISEIHGTTTAGNQSLNSLWVSSALRFFSLHDLMTTLDWDQAIHVESDNLLYRDLWLETIPHLQANYKSLAATPMTGYTSSHMIIDSYCGYLPCMELYFTYCACT